MTPAALLAGAPPISLFDALVLGLVEGLTEFLPISSTGHLIVAESLLGLHDSPLGNVFTIGIQMGAITAILVIYWQRLFDAARTILRPAAGSPNLLLQIVVAAMPAAVLGLLADDWIDGHLFSVAVVALTMVGGGVLLLWLERFVGGGGALGRELPEMSYRTALWIGLFQCLALVPGTSRSAATIGGALLLGLSRTAAAEFSFLVGLPILYGASLWKLVKHRDLLTSDVAMPLCTATVVAFLSALVVVRPFVRFLRANTFAPFAWYRIAGGLLLGIASWRGWIE